MPYIDKENRKDIDGSMTYPRNAGELNYFITKNIHEYLERSGVSYDNINEVIGVLECAKLELYRRIATPYEDKKIKENGDVLSSKIASKLK